MSKLTVSFSVPSLPFNEYMYCMLSTPAICCSMGVATDCATVSASAPIYVVWTWISGGAILGNCAVGRPSIATTPAMTIRIEMTIATIGRLMKNLDMLFALSRSRLYERFGIDRHSVTHLHESLD